MEGDSGGSGDYTGYPGDVWEAPGGNQVRVEEIEAQIQEVMGTVDGILEEAQQEGGRDASGSAGQFPTPGGGPGDSGGTAAGGGSGAGGGSETTSGEDSSEGGYAGSSSGQTGTTVQTPSGGRPDYGEDSDTFRRQICEAAREESDPELREALEAECRKYGGGVR